MSETSAEPTKVGPKTQAACDIAAGRAPADPASVGMDIIGAKKDLNAKGRGDEWYRLVWRSRSWGYVSSKRLPAGNFLAKDRRAEVYGSVFHGELVAQHDRGGQVNTVRLVIAPDDTGKCLVTCAFAVRRDGNMTVTLPDGSEVIVPNPRKS